MQREKLIRMANQIADFFAPQGDERAVGEIANHLTRFWPPRMRAELQAYVADGGAELRPLGLEAVRRLDPPTRGTVG